MHKFGVVEIFHDTLPFRGKKENIKNLIFKHYHPYPPQPFITFPLTNQLKQEVQKGAPPNSQLIKVRNERSEE